MLVVDSTISGGYLSRVNYYWEITLLWSSSKHFTRNKTSTVLSSILSITNFCSLLHSCYFSYSNHGRQSDLLVSQITRLCTYKIHQVPMAMLLNVRHLDFNVLLIWSIQTCRPDTSCLLTTLLSQETLKLQPDIYNRLWHSLKCDC